MRAAGAFALVLRCRLPVPGFRQNDETTAVIPAQAGTQYMVGTFAVMLL
jgi:hypothetical protein